MKDNNIKKKMLALPCKIVLVGILFFILSLITFNIGCQTLDNTGNLSDKDLNVSSGNSTDTENGVADENGDEDTPDGGEESGEEDNSTSEEGDLSGEDTGNNAEEQSDEAEGDLYINIYYADLQVKYLVGESRKISRGENKYVEALNELMKLPVNSSLIRLIPDTTVINSVEAEKGIAKVDLSANFVEDRLTSDTEDILLVYSVVNTLTEFSDVDAVYFYIDGKKLNVLGMLDLQNPCYRRSDLIKS